MFAPHHQAQRRRARAGLPPRRHDRPGQLDAGRLHRADVRDHEAVRPAAAARASSRRRCGATRTTCAGCSATGSPTCGPRRTVRGRPFATPEEFLDYFKAHYGPTIAAYRGLADDPARAPRSTPSWWTSPGGSTAATATTVMEWEYLLVAAWDAPSAAEAEHEYRGEDHVDVRDVCRNAVKDQHAGIAADVARRRYGRGRPGSLRRTGRPGGRIVADATVGSPPEPRRARPPSGLKGRDSHRMIVAHRPRPRLRRADDERGPPDA